MFRGSLFWGHCVYVGVIVGTSRDSSLDVAEPADLEVRDSVRQVIGGECEERK